MANINAKFTEDEMAKLLEKKLAESKRQGRELSWSEFILISAEKVSK